MNPITMKMTNNSHQLQLCHTETEAFDLITQRRAANYKPSIWNYDLLQSLESQYNGEVHRKQAEMLKKIVSSMFDEPIDQMTKLELIDDIEKLGLAYIFKDKIEEALPSISSGSKEEDVRAAALCFRILRQHGFKVSQDMLQGYIQEKVAFRDEFRENNVEGMLELFEASYLAIEGENILDEAQIFSSKYLKEITRSSLNKDTVEHINHTLEVSSHQRVPWYNSKWQINAYKNEQTNSSLLELAKINFNWIQAIHQKELMDLSRWWKNFGLIGNLNFTRDRLVESFLFAVGVSSDPQDGCFRKWLTKVIILVLIIDDTYDIYGSLEELELFTNAVQRWDPEEITKLPECMKICFAALYDITNEMANEIQLEQTHVEVFPLLKRVWADFCQALLVESKWYNNSYTPTLQEYLSNAWISSSGPILCLHAFLSVTHNVTEEMIKFYESNQELVHCSSLIVRLSNDLGTSAAELERGDVPSSVLCHMREGSVSEEESRYHIKKIMNTAWKNLNEQGLMQPPTMQRFVSFASNVARVANFIYQDGDGIGNQDHGTRDTVLSILIEPLVIS